MLGAVARHAAMLRYLDNDQNAVRAINGTTRARCWSSTPWRGRRLPQHDVQELARVLTGFGVRIDPEPAKVAPKFASMYRRDGLFEFTPARHDFGDKVLLGHTIRAAASRSSIRSMTCWSRSRRRRASSAASWRCSSSATSRRSRRRRDGRRLPAQQGRHPVHAAAGCCTRRASPQSMPRPSSRTRSLLLSSLRAGFEQQSVQNAQPLHNWMRRLGQGLYDKLTPDGYPLTADAWDSPGQMTQRFEVARQIGGGRGRAVPARRQQHAVPISCTADARRSPRHVLPPASTSTASDAGRRLPRDAGRAAVRGGRGSAALPAGLLRGGYDATNLLVPTGSSFYYEQRPRIAIARPGPVAAASGVPDPNAALPIDANWGLHPALRNSVYPLMQAGQARFIPFAGTEDLSRSHFETQDSIELGQPVGGSRDYNSGFLNRLAAELDAQQALSFTDQLPVPSAARCASPTRRCAKPPGPRSTPRTAR
ncbi:hypothetical protein Ddc_19117 [Ditylenchus destructor]|nr:hypothetical protein Ddc_19117 [Ditylenchus destructor]